MFSGASTMSIITLSIRALSIMTLSIRSLSIRTLSIMTSSIRILSICLRIRTISITMKKCHSA
jgi:hypothetical protein